MVAAGTAAYLIAGCGGSGGGGNGGGISGTEDVKSFVIAAGHTVVVNGDLTVHATQNIEIDGTLQIPEGVSVALISDGPFVNKGAIVPATSSEVASVSDRRLERGGNPPAVFSGAPGSIFGSIGSPKGTDIDIAINSSGDLYLTSVVAGNGLASTKKGVDGGIGGSVEIGTAKANAASVAKWLGHRGDARQHQGIRGVCRERRSRLHRSRSGIRDRNHGHRFGGRERRKREHQR